MPVAMISTSTSPALGPSRSTSTISSGCLGAKATAARVFMSPPFLLPSILRGGGSRRLTEGPLHQLRWSPSPANAGEEIQGTLCLEEAPDPTGNASIVVGRVER